MNRPRIAVVYTHFPHYRSAVFSALAKSVGYEFSFYYDLEGVDDTIANGVAAERHHPLRVRRFGPLMWQGGALKLAFSKNIDGLIFLGNPFILSTWVAAAATRIRGKPVFFWTHGWLAPERGWRAWLRLRFYKLADGLLVYGHRAKSIGREAGMPSERMHVVGNSLDYEVQKAAREDFEASISGRRPRIQPIVEGAYFLAVARLVRSVEMSLAIEAMAKMPPGVTLVIVGAGPERESLEAQAVALNVPVRFLGPIYDEAALASLFSRACAVVSPGKVGLLALHALAYGAPVITHGDLDHQMPEVEAITPGITGAFYRRGDAADLADKMAQFLCVPSRGPEYDVRRASAISMIEENYTPEIQVKNITTTLNAHF